MGDHGIDINGDVATARRGLIAGFKCCLPPGRRLDSKLQASMELAADFLLSHANAPASDDQLVLERANALEPDARSFVQHVLQLGLLVRQLIDLSRTLPPSNGYQTLLTTSCGLDPVFARLASAIITRHGRREARDALIYGDVVQAIRFLSQPGQNIQAARVRIAFLLKNARETTVLEPILPDATDEHNFIRLLEIAIEDGQTPELTARCAELVPHLKLKRGPKTSAASFAHQFLLEHLPTENRAYTFSDVHGDFIDPRTEATRREFGEPNFDPRPAYRRAKAGCRR